MRKTLGIIGGMGPLATQVLYKRIIDRTEASCDQEHLDMIILSHASIPDRTAAIRAGKTEELFAMLLKDAKMLEENGAGVIAVPCNTSHYFWQPLQEQMGVPIIHMVRRTVETIREKKPDIQKIGVLATDGTVFTGIYHQECARLGIECVTPGAREQQLVMDIIYKQVKKGLDGSIEDFSAVDAYLKGQGCQAAVLACTELSCFNETHRLSDFYVDALDVLCDEAITLCGGTLRRAYVL
ncbi:MAG TPA: amino acid racemase [Candidatus Avimonoglobus intestinipullorum]|uniref:Amino acid racemase n=1 Tax=Candidatus Avimonoglobus intestinipullorum TaxID=2840699 RepID=A0A9D1S6E8_9FIRM|nr:amino acid racemase [Candidatus Avimonoglobus intestinipullorum]